MHDKILTYIDLLSNLRQKPKSRRLCPTAVAIHQNCGQGVKISYLDEVTYGPNPDL